MAGRGVGAYPSNWFTTVYLYNPNAGVVSVDLSFLERNKDNVTTSPPKVTDTLAPGETRIYENIVETTFGKTAYGAVRIQCASKVVASARVFSKESADAPLTQSFGQDFAATPASFAIGNGESTDILGGYSTPPYQDSAARFNIGCVETTGVGSATVRWIARDGTGQQQKSYDRVVPRLSQTQGFFHQYFDGIDLTNARVSASVIAGNGRVICYGSLVTNDKTFPKPVQDPTTFEMVYPEKLLGIATVQHDATLVGDGTAGAPLGLADGAVSKAKLAAVGGTSGQVLFTNGFGLAWQPDGLTLPFSATVEGPEAALHVRNSSSASGTSGISSQGRVGVYGVGSAAGVLGVVEWPNPGFKTGSAVAGTTGSGTGVSGSALSGDGVEGGSRTGTGVHGWSDSGRAGFFEGPVQITGDLTCPGCVHPADVAPGGNGQVLTTSAGAASWQPPAGDIGAVNTASDSGLQGGAASGEVSLAVKNLGITTAMLASNAVTQAKLSPASGAAAGKVLGTDGANLQWQSDATLTLPFFQSGSWGGAPLFWVLNSVNSAIRADTTADGYAAVVGYGTSGNGVMGYATSGAGVYGLTDLSDGVLGVSTPGNGVHGTTGTGTGVRGEASGSGAGLRGSASTGSGVEGSSTSGAGVLGTSSSSYGVKGSSTSSFGVWAEGGSIGLYAHHVGGDGHDVYLATGALAGDFYGDVNVRTLAGTGNRAVYSTATGVLTNSSSDGRLKKDIVALADRVDVLAALGGLHGVEFAWDTAVERAAALGDRREIGLIAQEVENVLPQVVGADTEGFLTLDYAKLTAFLIEVAKAQQREIDELKAAMAEMQR